MKRTKYESIQEVLKRIRQTERRVALWGAADIGEKTHRIFSDFVDYFIDNNPSSQDTQFIGFDVKPAQAVLSLAEDKRPLILICSTSVAEIREQLLSAGYDDRLVMPSPILTDFQVIDDLESHEVSLLATSGSPAKDGNIGGGLYRLDRKGEDFSYHKVIAGNMHGLVEIPEGYLVVDDYQGILQLSKSLEITKTIELPAGLRPHGLALDPTNDGILFAASHSDAIFSVQPNGEVVQRISLSDKFQQGKVASHHCNDICTVGTSLYVSMFSITGNWRRDVFDGGILEFDLTTNKLVGPVIQDLWMPHNITFIDGSLTVLDSLRGQLKQHNASVIGEFPAFTRGLAHDGVYFYIGQSRNRNFSKYMGLSKNISIDSGVIIFDPITKLSTTLNLPRGISEIHNLVVYSA